MKTKKTRRSFFRRWLRGFIAVIAVMTLLFAAGIGILVGYIKSLPPIEQLERYSPPQSTVLFDRTGKNRIARFARQNRVVVPLNKMPPNLKKAFIAVEDKRFYNHFGVDFLRTVKALLINIKRRRRAQGASTITQQLPRNLLKSVSRKKILSRKIKETLLAFQIERRYSKDQILEFYMNQIYLGNGAYGVQAASRTFFNKDVSNLSLAECAVLAGIPQLPARYSPINNKEASKRRRNIVLSLMYQQGKITRTQYVDAFTTPVRVTTPPPPPSKAPYFVEHVRRSLVKTKDLDNESLYKDGYVVYTTLDSDLQKIAHEELKKGLRKAEMLRQNHAIQYGLTKERETFGTSPPQTGKKRLAKVARVFSDTMNVVLEGYYGAIALPAYLPYYQPLKILNPGQWVCVVPTNVYHDTKTFFGKLGDENRIQGAVVILDTHSGGILAMCGGEDFYDFKNSGQWNRATQGPGRQPGSAIKPLFFACALENGFTLASMFEDKEIVFSDGYSPKNYENRYFGFTTLEEALEHSRNVVTVLLYMALKPDRALPFVRRFDILEDAYQWNLARDTTVCLGSLTATPLSLTAAYLPFVNKGVGIRPYGIIRVLSQDGKLVLEPRKIEREILLQETAAQITYALRGVIERGTAASVINHEPLSPEFPEVAGKTGTTNDYIDAWFIGYTPDLLIGVWVGFDKNISLGERMTGSRVAAPIWREIVLRAAALDQATASAKFPSSENLVYIDICSKSGLLATSQCRNRQDTVVYENLPFKRGTEPRDPCHYHR